MITDLNRIFTVENYEYGYNIDDLTDVKIGDSINLYVPKLMGAITETGTFTLKTNKLLKNSRECRPNINKNITIKNFIPIEVRSTDGMDTKVDENGVICKGTQFIVEYVNGNIQYPLVTLK